MNLFFILLKKEFFDFFKKKHNLFFLVMIILFICVFPLLEFDLPNGRVFSIKNNGFFVVNFLYIVFVSQMIFDSCNFDFKNGGTLFLINIKAGIIKSVLAKGCISVFMGFVFLFANRFELYKIIKIQDFSWILFFYLFINSLSYILSMISNNSSFIVYFIDGLLGLGLFFVLISVESLLYKLIIVLLAFVLCLIFVLLFFNSKRFRMILS